MSRLGPALLALVLSATACTTIRDFLIPPPSVQSRDRTSDGLRAVVVQASAVSGVAGADAVLVRGHRIAAVGAAADLPGGATVTNRSRVAGHLERGPVDERAALLLVALAEDGADLRAVHSLDRLGPALGAAIAVRSEGQLVLGWGLPPALFDVISAAQLDALVGDVPLALADADGRVRVNAAFSAAQTTGVRQAIEARRGRLEHGLDGALLRRFDLPIAARLRATLAAGLDGLHRAGLTGLSVVGVDTNTLRAVQDLEQGGRLAVRVRAWLDADDPGARAVLASAQRRHRRDEGAKQRRARGTPGARVRQRAAPTRGGRVVVAGLHVAVEGPFGRARLDAGTLRRIAAEVAERGASLSVGVASDAGVQAVIDALEPLRAGGRAPPVRVVLAGGLQGAGVRPSLAALGERLGSGCEVVLSGSAAELSAAPARLGGCDVVLGAAGPGTDWPAWIGAWRSSPARVRPTPGTYADLVVWPEQGGSPAAVFVGGDRQMPLD